MKSRIVTALACLFSVLFLVYVFRLADNLSGADTKLISSSDVLDVTDFIRTKYLITPDELPSGGEWTLSQFRSEGWKDIQLPAPVTGDHNFTAGNFAYYRIVLPAATQEKFSDLKSELSLALHYIGFSRYEVYVNGRFLFANTPRNGDEAMTIVPVADGTDNIIAIKGKINTGDVGISHRERILLGKGAKLNELYSISYKQMSVFPQIFILSKGSVLFVFTLIFLLISVSSFFEKFLVFGICVLAEDFLTSDALAGIINLNQLTFLFTAVNIGAVVFLFLFLADAAGKKLERPGVLLAAAVLSVAGILIAVDVLYTAKIFGFSGLLKFWNLSLSAVLILMLPSFVRKNRILAIGMAMSLVLTLWSTFFGQNVGLNYKAFGNLILFFSVASETFLLLRKEQVLLREKQKLLLEQEKDVAIGKTAAILAHDVRRPLEQMRMVLERISSGKTSAEFIEAAKRDVEFSLTSVNTQVNDIMNFSSVRTLELAPISFYRLLSASLKQVLTINQNVVLDISYNFKAMTKVMGDESLLAGVLTNLISNAVEAVRDIGKKNTGKLHLSTSREGDDFIFVITNDGPPIPEELLSEIWKPLMTRGKNHGTGLGLASVSRAVKEHGGSASVANSPEGVSFTVRLKTSGIEDQVADGDFRQSSKDYGYEVRTVQEKSSDKLRIFILDDDNQVFDYFRFLALNSSSAVEMTFAGTYAEAEKEVSSRRFDLYILDYDLGTTRTGADFYQQYLSFLSREVVLHTNRDEKHLTVNQFKVLPKPMPADVFSDLVKTVSASRLRILLVDDSELVREAWSTFHGSQNVVTASSPEEALKILENDRNFGTIVLDYYFDNSQMNGIDLGRVIREKIGRMEILLSSNVSVQTNEFKVIGKTQFEVRQSTSTGGES